MRNFTTLVLILASATIAVAQEPSQEPYTAYASIQGHSPCYVDYGQSSLRKNWIVDDDGNTIYFRSIIGALNYMSERGWRLVQPHTSVQSNILEAEKIESKTLWLLSKEVTSREEIAEGITTRQIFLEQTATAEQ